MWFFTSNILLLIHIYTEKDYANIIFKVRVYALGLIHSFDKHGEPFAGYCYVRLVRVPRKLGENPYPQRMYDLEGN